MNFKFRFDAYMQLSIIIVNYNVKHFLEQCLYSVQKAINGMDAEVLVVDNASVDGSIDYLASRFPRVEFIWNKSNPGFAKANNTALQKAKGELVLFLNPDTILAEDTLSKCIHFLQTHTHAGAVGVRMIDGSGTFLPESKRAFPSSSVSFFKLSGLSFLFPRSKVFARYHLGHLSEHETHKVDVLSGAFMMVRKKLLLQTGGFDEDFFMYGEDIDLSYRLQQLQYTNGVTYSNYYVSDTTIIHYKGESTQKGSYKYVQQFYKAMLLFVKKHPQQFYNGALNLLIQLAIAVRGVMSWIGHLFKTGSAVEKKTNETAFVIGTNELTQVISSNYPSLTIKGNALTIEEAIPYLKETDTILLCEAEQLSFQQIIAITEKFGKQYSIYVHANGSNSMVSSSSKNKSGKVIVSNLV
jgi:GT2 family glycosyltransferase